VERGPYKVNLFTYKVNFWMWRYGRGRSRMVSIAEAERTQRIRAAGERLI
jgi:hypothetical protein